MFHAFLPGSVVNYDSFGNPTANIQTRYTYTGREWDADAGLYYYRARYYDPQARRFTSEDPIGLSGGINLYGYVGNDPLNRTDPSGESWIGKLAKVGVVKGLRTKTAHMLLQKGKNLFATDMSKKQMRREIKKAFPERKPKYHTKDSTACKYGEHAQPNIKDVADGQHLFKSEAYKLGRNIAGALTVEHYLGDNWFASTIDLFNPLSIAQDTVDIIDEVDSFLEENASE